MLKKTLRKMGGWLEDIWDWIDWNSDVILFIFGIVMIVGLVVLVILLATGFFYNEVENYDFTAVVVAKEHYTTSHTSYVKSGDSTIPITNTTHHYTVQWEDGDIRDTFEVGQDHYNKMAVGDFINVHCSVKEDKQGKLHYYYSFKGY